MSEYQAFLWLQKDFEYDTISVNPFGDDIDKICVEAPTSPSSTVALINTLKDLDSRLKNDMGIPDGTLMTAGSPVTCRESVLYNFQNALSGWKIVHSGLYFHPKPYIKITAESGEYISSAGKKYIDTLMRFDQKFFRNHESDFRLHFVGKSDKTGGPEYLVLESLDSVGGDFTPIYTMSVLLWIFRNSHIMESLLTHFEAYSFVSTNTLLRYLVTGFLDNADWGNLYNQRLYLSLYCYTVNHGHSYTVMTSNGPSNLALFTPMHIAVQYVQEILFPKYHDLEGLPFNSLISGNMTKYMKMNSALNAVFILLKGGIHGL